MQKIKLNKNIYSIDTIKRVTNYLKNYIEINFYKEENHIILEVDKEYENEVIDYLNYFEFKNGLEGASEE